MKLSFSTRGWREMPWPEQVRDASELRFQGIEVYNLHRCASLTNRGVAFHRFSRNETLRDLREHNLVIPCFDTSIDLSDSNEDTAPAFDLMDTAAAMHIPYVAFCALHDDEPLIRGRLNDLLPAAADKGICVLIKTVGIFADTGRLRRLMDDYACDELAALWDMHHPYRDYHESPDMTIRNLGGYVRHVHLRDSGKELSNSFRVRDIANKGRALHATGFFKLPGKSHQLFFSHLK